MLFLLAGRVFAQEFTVNRDEVKGNEPDYSPYVDRNIPDRVFFGDTHHHTSNSPDAGLVGNTLGPDMAYRFARGEEITSSTGLRVKLNRPLDFLVVSDHAEYLGLPVMLRSGDPALLADATGKRWYEMYNAGADEAYNLFVDGGWDFAADEVERPDFADAGYARGVPMGGDLTSAPAGKAPTFLIRALRDGDGANLDRVQMIKGWLDDAGEQHERIYDVAVSDGRAIGADGRCKTPVRTTVDIADASYTNTIGDPLLTVHWVDPHSDPDQRAFYYVRVIEIPKPRWTAYDAKRFGVTMPDDVKMTVQDRAYTSPIWYTP